MIVGRIGCRVESVEGSEAHDGGAHVELPSGVLRVAKVPRYPLGCQKLQSIDAAVVGYSQTIGQRGANIRRDSVRYPIRGVDQIRPARLREVRLNRGVQE